MKSSDSFSRTDPRSIIHPLHDCGLGVGDLDRELDRGLDRMLNRTLNRELDRIILKVGDLTSDTWIGSF